ncbi:hypothetical protein PA25_15920 [Pseudoalteromonas sp. A25]|uniref:hypothetical protein n=1 Tax=Pseudoalteromonas sp. A25 TaxID=116092 RepID=UPI0012605F77|nr:hypothetical protein [Pseudoalteromonas sp. A25]BBN81607.1 hypothetical protein PA25_15920 [Pseudoalteromonas sp. A25]
MRKSLLVFLFLTTGCTGVIDHNQQKFEPIDTADLRADIQVIGRTSKLKQVDIAYLGKAVPATYSDGKIGNSRGYNWWVSKHFALKSDLSEEKVRLYLELLEMAYPHYVELFGMEPPNIENQRIAVVYGSSRARLKEAMLDDGFLRGIHKNAGGETMYYNRAGYNFPSHREHHQRYIVIHETMHAFHMALNGHSTWAPNWITEGLADAIASHVYYPDKQQLTVMVFDRAPMNYITTGLEQYQQSNKPTIEQINDDPQLKRGLNFFVIHFLMADPIRQLYFKRYLSNLMALNPHSEHTLPTANKLLKTTFNDWHMLEKQFAQFVQSIKPTFNIVSGPWEQDGNAYWLRSDDAKSSHQLDISANPQAKHAVLDFPKPEWPIQLENSAWLVAAKLDFEPSQLHRGEIGIAMYQGDTPLPLKLKAANRFELELLAFGEKNQVLALKPELTEDLKQGQALTFAIKQRNNELLVTVYTQYNKQVMTFELPFNTTISNRKASLIGKGMNHKITPYLHQHQFELPKLNKSTADPWYFNHTALFVKLLNTCENALIQLHGCRKVLAELAIKLKMPSEHANIESQLSLLAQQWQPQIAKYSAHHHVTPRYEQTFDGVHMDVENKSELDIAISGPYSGKTTGTLSVYFYSFEDSAQSAELWQQHIKLRPYEQEHWSPDIANLKQLKNGIVHIKAKLEVDGEPLLLSKQLIY